MEYTAVIRTLGKAGEKYQKLLDSLVAQTVRPKQIIVYIAEGYPIPKETVGVEKYVYVKKGMVAQRALPYDEVDTEFILCLDDDLELPRAFVDDMFRAMEECEADVISPDIFPNHERSPKQEFMMSLSGRMVARRGNDSWGYKVLRTGGYSYRKRILKSVYRSQTNAGACFLCRKSDFLKVHFDEELWLDSSTYALGDDQVMFYKMHMLGLKVYTIYNSGIIHLDAGENLNSEKEMMLVGSDIRFKIVFWHRFIYQPERNLFVKILDILCIAYYLLFTIMVSILKIRFDMVKNKIKAMHSGLGVIISSEYKQLPTVVRTK
ncbi:MAG: glycosyl transferase family 2 [Candidatus Cryptobacteroides sp.]